MIEWLKNPWAWGLPWTHCVSCDRFFWRTFPPYCFEEHCCKKCADDEYEFVESQYR